MTNPASSIGSQLAGVFMPAADDYNLGLAQQVVMSMAMLVSAFMACYVFMVGVSGQAFLLGSTSYPFFAALMLLLAFNGLALALGYWTTRLQLWVVLCWLMLALLALNLNGLTGIFAVAKLLIYTRLTLPRYLAHRVFVLTIISLLPNFILSPTIAYFSVFERSLVAWILMYVVLDHGMALLRASNKALLQQRLVKIFCGVGVVTLLLSALLAWLQLITGSVGFMLSFAAVLVILMVLVGRVPWPLLSGLLWGGTLIYYGLALNAGLIGQIMFAQTFLVLGVLVFSARQLAVLLVVIYFVLYAALTNPVTQALIGDDAWVLQIFTILCTFTLLGQVHANIKGYAWYQRGWAAARQSPFLPRFGAYLALGLFAVSFPLIVFSLQDIWLLPGVTWWTAYIFLLFVWLVVAISAWLFTLRDFDEDLLIEQKEAADQADQSQLALLQAVTRDIRNPLSNVLLLLPKLQQQQGIKADWQMYLSTIESSAKRLQTLMGNIIEASELHKTRVVIQPAPFDLPATLDHIAQELAPLAQEQGVAMSFSAQLPSASQWLGDELRVTQVIVNLINNAIKFSPKGRVEVLAKQCGNGVSIQVIDNGVGMDAATLARVFKRFEQADRSLTRKYEGLGLGLSLCRELVDLMGGSLEVVSAPGQGSTFTVQLPLAITQQDLPEQATVPDKVPLGDITQCRVLLVEDDLVSRQVLQLAFQEQITEVAAVKSGQEALAHPLSQSADIIITDISMPDMDGAELLHALRANGATMPIVALTGNAPQQDVAHFSQQGFAAVLIKPAEVVEVLSVIAQYTQQGGSIQ